MNRRFTPAAAAYFLLLLVVAVYYPVFGHQFINFDDGGYITNNPMVQSGFTAASLRWAFTSFDCANWHPLTWISHMLDHRIFGPLPFGSHLMNVVYHAVSAALLFLLLQRSTGAFWPGFLTAALFAVHPLRVESVAWAAERKDVLSALFWMLTMLAYLAYARRPGAGRYTLALVAFALGLMAKPMLVTLPVILLVLDWWPLGRTRGAGPPRDRLGRLLLEKVPFLALSAISAVITFQAQSIGGAVVPLKSFSVGHRLASAAVAVTVYLSKIVWPTKLSMLYARPNGGTGLEEGAMAALPLIVASVAALFVVRRRPYLLAGWSWFLIALLPVLGLVQVGYQPWADRYTYIPSIGFTLAALWLVADLFRSRRRARIILSGAGAAAVLVLSVATRSYLPFWNDGERLFRRALNAGGDTYMMRFCLAGELAEAGRVDEAIVEFTRGLALNPVYPDGHFGMGVAFDMKGNAAKAAQHYRRALELDPNKVDAHVYFGYLLERTGDPAGAEDQYREALRLQSGSTSAREGVCRILADSSRTFAAPLFPWCGGRSEDWDVWRWLDKVAADNYVRIGFEWPSGALTERTGG